MPNGFFPKSYQINKIFYFSSPSLHTVACFQWLRSSADRDTPQSLKAQKIRTKIVEALHFGQTLVCTGGSKFLLVNLHNWAE